MPNNKKKKNPTLAALQFCQAMIAPEIFSLKYLFFVFLFFFSSNISSDSYYLSPEKKSFTSTFLKNPKTCLREKKIDSKARILPVKEPWIINLLYFLAIKKRGVNLR